VLRIDSVVTREKDTILLEAFLVALGAAIEDDGELKAQLLLGHGLNGERQVKRGPCPSDKAWGKTDIHADFQNLKRQRARKEVDIPFVRGT
jgi:hypothetical protein